MANDVRISGYVEINWIEFSIMAFDERGNNYSTTYDYYNAIM